MPADSWVSTWTVAVSLAPKLVMMSSGKMETTFRPGTEMVLLPPHSTLGALRDDASFGDRRHSSGEQSRGAR